MTPTTAAHEPFERPSRLRIALITIWAVLALAVGGAVAAEARGDAASTTSTTTNVAQP